MWDSPVTVSPFDDRYDAPVTLIPSTCIAYLPLKGCTEADKARIHMYCLLDERESGNERLFTDTMLAIFYQFDRI
jgi:hypothetical protein